MRFQNLESWLTWMEQLHPREIDLGLDRVGLVARNLDLLNLSSKIITVAGTNGKGSCVHALQKILLASGASVGSYTSPHIEFYNERISIDGIKVSDERLCVAFDAIDQARGEISLSYFEFGTLAALFIFKQSALDYCVLEVGLGGRLDAVNILDPDVAVITSIDIDHEAWLGNNRNDIGVEKAGILRENIPFICADLDMPESVRQIAFKLNCASFIIGRDFSVNYPDKNSPDNIVLSIGSNADTQILIDAKNCSLPATSVAAAAQAAALLDVDFRSVPVLNAFNDLRLSGRFEKFNYGGVNWILDVAHNPAAANNLALNLDRHNLGQLTIVTALMSDKDAVGVYLPISARICSWVLAPLVDLPRAMTTSELKSILSDSMRIPDSNIEIAQSMKDAIFRAGQHAKTEGTAVLVMGSFYLLSEFKNYFSSMTSESVPEL